MDSHELWLKHKKRDAEITKHCKAGTATRREYLIEIRRLLAEARLHAGRAAGARS